MTGTKTKANPPLLGCGNAKIGNKTITFSLPAAVTCPYATELCKERCYALKGFFLMPGVKRKLQLSWDRSKEPDFHKKVVDELAKHVEGIFRVHPSGDFYDATYARKWLYILKHSPHITFWIYTRSWRNSVMRKIFERMADLPNVHFWFSVDKETGHPKGKIHPRIRLAYMMVSDDDVPVKDPHLYFRDYPIRGSVRKHIHGSLVCPPENGATHTTCDKCRICLSDPKVDPRRRTLSRFEPVEETSGRIPLQMA